MNDPSALAAAAAPVERLHGDCWRIADDGVVELIGSRCTACGTVYLPQSITCARCGGRTFTALTLAPAGTLYSYSIVHRSGGVWPDLYAVGYVDFPEGVRVFGQLRADAPAALAVGARAGLEAATLYRRKDGAAVTCFRFVVAKQERT